MLSAGPLLAAVVGGTLLTYAWDDESALSARLCLGAPLGMALFGLLGLLLAGFGGVDEGTAWLSAAFLLMPVLLLARPGLRQRCESDVAAALGRLRRPGRAEAATALACLVGAALLWAIFDRAMFERDGGVYTGVEHNIGDLPFHIGVVNNFAFGDNLPPEHPELAGTRLTYPILADFVAALLVRSGMSLRHALLGENLLLALALAGLMFGHVKRLTGDRCAAFLAPPLLLLSGGLGFLLFLEDWSASGLGLLALLHHLPRDYTITWTGELRWGNVLTTLLIPQRSLLLGAPLAVAIWTLWWSALGAGTDIARQCRLMTGAGFLAGLLPLAHVHAFLSVLAMAGCLSLLFWRPRVWPLFFVPALAVAAPQVAWMAAGSAVRTGSVLDWHLGWDRGGRNAAWFWLTNTGLLLPVLAAALWRVRREAIGRFYAPFLLLFVVPNILKLSPWIWDNIKFLFFWYAASVPLVAGLLSALWGSRSRWRWLTPVLAAGLMLSGALDVWRVVSRQIAIEIFDAEAVAFASGPVRATSQRALILHAPTHNSPVYLAGRRSLLGYPGHIWSQGLDAGVREAEIRRMYAGATDASELLSSDAVDYILVGPQERGWTRVDDGFLSAFPAVAETGAYRLLKAR